ncbi:MAG: tetratricopeptide repeat protein [Candidatus Zixiibacteriota bacterium]
MPALCATPSAAQTSTAEGISRLQVRIAVLEILTADTTESALVDSLTADVSYDRETTLRVGNFVLYLTVSPQDAGHCRMQYTLFVPGPLPDNRSEDVTVEYDAPVLVDAIRGKGKSTYRAMIFPHRVVIPPSSAPPLDDTTARVVMPAPDYYFYLPPGEIPQLHFLPLRDALVGEFEHVRDTFAFTAPGRVHFYLVESSTEDFPLDPRWRYGVDPARNRIAALYDKRASGVDVSAMLLLNLYRWWGYAPELLAVGVAGFATFADHDVLADRARHTAIPLDSIVRTLDFKRCDPRVAAHQAASFVRWLIHEYGRERFRDLYDRSTDLSLRRAAWAVYGKTLGELEAQWLAYLGQRRFTRDEIDFFAERARYYRRYEEYVSLLREAVAADSTLDAGLVTNLGLAQAHIGRWADAASAFAGLIRSYPDTAAYHWLSAEALWAQGNTVGCVGELTALQRLSPDDPRPWLRLGDMQYEVRRRDSAAVLWGRAFDHVRGTRTAIELLLRLGRYQDGQPGGSDSAAQLFSRALRMATEGISVDPNAADGWILGGEALLGVDSLNAAITYFRTADYLSDAAIDYGRIHLGLGACHDRAGRRREAVAEYESVIGGPSAAPDRRWAKYYINKPYRY